MKNLNTLRVVITLFVSILSGSAFADIASLVCNMTYFSNFTSKIEQVTFNQKDLYSCFNGCSIENAQKTGFRDETVISKASINDEGTILSMQLQSIGHAFSNYVPVKSIVMGRSELSGECLRASVHDHGHELSCRFCMTD